MESGSILWNWLNGEMPGPDSVKVADKHVNCECCNTRKVEDAIVKWWE